MLANRLSADPAVRVGLMEAGGHVTDPRVTDPLAWPLLGGAPFDWAYRTLPQAGTAGRVHEWPRGRGVGGSSLLHAMAHVRGHPEDFASWAQAGGARWSHAGLLPGFERAGPMLHPAAEVHELTRAFMAAGRAFGLPDIAGHNAGPMAGVTPNTLAIVDGRRITVAGAYLHPASDRANLTLLTGCMAERLTFDGNRVTGVLTTAGPIAADRVVLAAGAIGSPLLLMRSGIGHPGVLAEAGLACRSALPQVGDGLQDHLLAGILIRAPAPLAPSRLQHSESLMYLRAADASRNDGPPDVVVACVLLPAVPGVTAPIGSAWTLLCGACRPTSRGTLRPGGPGSGAHPRIDPAYLSTEADRAGMRNALRFGREIAAQAPLASWHGGELAPGNTDLDTHIAAAAITHHHPAGTCALGTVVDADLRVRGMDDLFVVDASIMPTLPSGPIHAAVLAIAETFAAKVWPAVTR